MYCHGDDGGGGGDRNDPASEYSTLTETYSQELSVVNVIWMFDLTLNLRNCYVDMC